MGAIWREDDDTVDDDDGAGDDDGADAEDDCTGGSAVATFGPFGIAFLASSSRASIIALLALLTSSTD